MKAFHLSQQWDAKLGFDLACYKVELGSFDFFFLSVLGIFNNFYFLNGFVIFSFPIFSSWLIWRWKRQFVLFFKEPSFLLFGLVFTSKLFFHDSCFCIFAKVSKNKAVDDFRNFWIIVFSTVLTKIIENMNFRICLIFTGVSQNAKTFSRKPHFEFGNPVFVLSIVFVFFWQSKLFKLY